MNETTQHPGDYIPAALDSVLGEYSQLQVTGDYIDGHAGLCLTLTDAPVRLLEADLPGTVHLDQGYWKATPSHTCQVRVAVFETDEALFSLYVLYGNQRSFMVDGGMTIFPTDQPEQILPTLMSRCMQAINEDLTKPLIDSMEGKPDEFQQAVVDYMYQAFQHREGLQPACESLYYQVNGDQAENLNAILDWLDESHRDDEIPEWILNLRQSAA